MTKGRDLSGIVAVQAATAAKLFGIASHDWQDVSGSRAAGTDYQNTTGHPLMVYVRFNSANGASTTIQVGPATNAYVSKGQSNGQVGTDHHVLVPIGHYYKVSGAGGWSGIWQELRA